MSKIIGVFLTGITLAFLTACGGGSSDGTVSATSETEAENKLQGTWVEYGGCEIHPDLNLSFSYELTFNDTDASSIYKEYNNKTCDDNGLSLHIEKTYEVMTGDATTGATGENAFEINFLNTSKRIIVGSLNGDSTGETFYTMYRFDDIGSLLIAEEENATAPRDGTSPDKRVNTFFDNEKYDKK